MHWQLRNPAKSAWGTWNGVGIDLKSRYEKAEDISRLICLGIQMIPKSRPHARVNAAYQEMKTSPRKNAEVGVLCLKIIEYSSRFPPRMLFVSK